MIIVALKTVFDRLLTLVSILLIIITMTDCRDIGKHNRIRYEFNINCIDQETSNLIIYGHRPSQEIYRSKNGTHQEDRKPYSPDQTFCEDYGKRHQQHMLPSLSCVSDSTWVWQAQVLNQEERKYYDQRNKINHIYNMGLSVYNCQKAVIICNRMLGIGKEDMVTYTEAIIAIIATIMMKLGSKIWNNDERVGISQKNGNQTSTNLFSSFRVENHIHYHTETILIEPPRSCG